MTKKLVFIASLEHSGSTLLDLILGGHPRFIGLGEVFLLLKPGAGRLERINEEFCSCGQAMLDCPFWGPLCAKLIENSNLSLSAKYELVLNAFYETFGEDCIPVDSSKDLAALEALKDLSDLDISVLYLIKDVRSWIISIRDVKKRSNDFYLKDLLKTHGIKAALPYLGRTATFLSLRWYYSNRKRQTYFKENNIAHFQLGYEELSLYPEFLGDDICRFLNVEPVVETMLSLKTSGSHSVLGNRMRSQKEKRERIFYDNRWFYRRDWLLPALLFPNIIKYNSEQVYHNTQTKLWHK